MYANRKRRTQKAQQAIDEHRKGDQTNKVYGIRNSSRSSLTGKKEAKTEEEAQERAPGRTNPARTAEMTDYMLNRKTERQKTPPVNGGDTHKRKGD